MAAVAGPIPTGLSSSQAGVYRPPHLRRHDHPSKASKAALPPVPDPYYGHEEIAKICSRYIQDLFLCPDVPAPSPNRGGTRSQALTPSLSHFIAYAHHRTRLHPSVTFAALLILSRLRARFPNARASSGHRLFIGAFMVAQKVLMDDTYSYKSWCVVAQGMFPLPEVKLMEHELCSYLEWNLQMSGADLTEFETAVRKKYEQDPWIMYDRVLAALATASAASSTTATPVATPLPLARIQDGQNALALFSRQRVWIRDNLRRLQESAHPADRLLETLDSIVARFETMKGGGPHRRIIELIARARAIVEEEFGDDGEARSFREAYRAFYKLLSKEDGAGRMTWTEQCINLHAELLRRAKNMKALSLDQLQHLQGLMHEFETSKDALSQALSGTGDVAGSEKQGLNAKVAQQHPLVAQLEIALKDMIHHQRALTQYWKDREAALSALGADPRDAAERKRQSEEWGSIGQAAFAADPSVPQLSGSSPQPSQCALPPSPATTVLEATVDSSQRAASGCAAVEREVQRVPIKKTKSVTAALEQTRDELSSTLVEQRSMLRQCAAFAHHCSTTLQYADGSVATDVAVLVRKLRSGVISRAEAHLAQLVGMQSRFAKLGKRLGAVLYKWAPPTEFTSFAPRHWQMFAVESSSSPTHPTVVNALAQLAFLCDKAAQAEHWKEVKAILWDMA